MVIGIDEAGRGPWAGPLVAGAVCLRSPIAGLRDSKKLTKLRRTRLAAEIKVEAAAWGLGWVSPGELDEVGMTEAVRLAMRRALDELERRLAQTAAVGSSDTNAVKSYTIIIDGSINYLVDDARTSCLIRADDSVPEVSAASILAKVARDRYMEQASLEYPEYSFDRHAGYGTAAHLAALQQHGPCPLHRQSFAPIKKICANPGKLINR